MMMTFAVFDQNLEPFDFPWISWSAELERGE
jgi:hypothetical protein